MWRRWRNWQRPYWPPDYFSVYKTSRVNSRGFFVGQAPSFTQRSGRIISSSLRRSGCWMERTETSPVPTDWFLSCRIISSSLRRGSSCSGGRRQAPSVRMNRELADGASPVRTEKWGWRRASTPRRGVCRFCGPRQAPSGRIGS